MIYLPNCDQISKPNMPYLAEIPETFCGNQFDKFTIDYTTFSKNSVDADCQAFCDANSKCFAYAYNSDNSGNNLKNCFLYGPECIDSNNHIAGKFWAESR